MILPQRWVAIPGNYNIFSGKDFSKLTGEKYKDKSDIVIRPELIEISNTSYPADEKYYDFFGTIKNIIPQGNIIRYSVKSNNNLINIDVLNNEKDFYKIGQEVFFRTNKKSLLIYK